MSKILSNPVLIEDLTLAGIYIAILVLGVLPLLFNVIRFRIKHRVLLGDEGHTLLKRAVRAHGNYVETVPFTLVLLLTLAQTGAAPLAIHLTGISIIVGRILHAIGLLRTDKPALERGFGMLLTIFSFIIGSVALVWHILS